MIKQCRFSNSVKFFEPEFLKLWKLNEYSNINQSAVFVGVYNEYDIKAILSHISHAIVVFCGADMNNIKHIKHLPDLTFLSTIPETTEFLKKHNVKIIEQTIPMKSYKNFTPVKKGSKIYVYHNCNTLGAWEKYGMNYLKPVTNYFGFDNFIFGTHGKTIKYVQNNYYANSFINIQINPFAGFTSALEMAHMGRPSVSNNKAPFCINFTDHNDIIRIIEREKNNNELNLSVYKYLDYSNKWLKI